jgi:hypothetical protein
LENRSGINEGLHNRGLFYCASGSRTVTVVGFDGGDAI